MELNQYKAFHFVGIGGVGMRALAKILLEKGFRVSGSDVASLGFLKSFERRGAKIFSGHKKEYIDGADVLIVSSAIPSANPEVTAAKERGIPVFHRSDVLADIFRQGKGIAVAGSHGKSTTSAMIGQIFCHAHADPTIILGGSVDYISENARLGKSEYIIGEADESDGSFLKFHTFLDVITNIEDDHLDHYGTLDNIKSAFLEFVDHIADREKGAVVLCIDNGGVKSILPKLTKQNVITYGTDPSAAYRAVNVHYEGQKMLFDIMKENENIGTVTLQIPGIYNVRNALAATAVSLYCDIPFDQIREALFLFHGVKRRFQIKYREDVTIVDDYAHHPTEIASTLQAAKESGAHRVICLFQPHRYSRTQLLQKEFAEAFDRADILLFTDIYSAGEEPIPGTDGELIPRLIRERLPKKEIHYVADKNDLVRTVYPLLLPGDMVITMGAGDIWQVGEDLIRLLGEKEERRD